MSSMFKMSTSDAKVIELTENAIASALVANNLYVVCSVGAGACLDVYFKRFSGARGLELERVRIAECADASNGARDMIRAMLQQIETDNELIANPV